MKVTMLAAMIGLGVPMAASAAVPGYIVSAVSAPRPKADTDRDASRKPDALLAFAGVKPGDKIGDLMPGMGYFTRLFSGVSGKTGHVYALIPSELAAKAPKMPDAMKLLAADPAYPNVSMIVAPAAKTGAPEKLDVVWTSQNYHDLYGFFGAAEAAATDAAVFDALKPGGVFVVVDHVAAAGHGGKDAATLHRIEPDTVKAQVLAAGFVLDGTSDVLRNPADGHDKKVFDPAIRGHTDQFIMKFRKPAK